MNPSSDLPGDFVYMAHFYMSIIQAPVSKIHFFHSLYSFDITQKDRKHMPSTLSKVKIDIIYA